MKKTLIIIIATLALVSCDNSAKDFAFSFVEAVNNNNKNAVVAMYPDAALFDIISPIAPDYGSIEVVKSENGHKRIRMGEISLDVLKKDGSLIIDDSWGLLAIPEDIRGFATSTGWVDAERSDKGNSIALKDEDFTVFVMNTIKDSLKLTVRLHDVFVEASFGRENYAIVTNNSDMDIPGELYYVVMTMSELGGEIYDAYGNFYDYDSKESYIYRQGVDVPARGNATIYVGGGDFEYGPSYFNPYIMFNKKSDVTKLKGCFTRKEYENYLAAKNCQ